MKPVIAASEHRTLPLDEVARFLGVDGRELRRRLHLVNRHPHQGMISPAELDLVAAARPPLHLLPQDRPAGDWVRDVRAQLGMTRAALAVRIGVTVSTVKVWERGFTNSLEEAHIAALQALQAIEAGRR